MQCYTEIAPPTAVSHAVHLPFIAPRANNLVVARNSLLQIFELKSTVTGVATNEGDATENAGPLLDTEAVDLPTAQRTENTAKLVLVGEFPLAGTVISLARMKVLNTKSKAEALLVAFRDAKLSLVEWDPETYNLHTISIHYYENPDLPGISPWSTELKDTYNFLSADPSNRCAALKFGAHNIAILPIRQKDIFDAEDDFETDAQRDTKMQDANGAEPQQETPYSASFVLPMTSLDPTLTHPVHLAFLYEAREPTFGVIASSKATAPSLLAERKDHLTYTVFTLNLEEKSSTTLDVVQGLPYDLTQVKPLPSPIGGALLLGSNEIIHVGEGGKTVGVAVNEFAKTSTAFSLKDQSELALHLEGCTAELLSQDSGDVLLVLNDGQLLTLTFTLDGRTVSGMTVQRVSADHGGQLLNSAASCMSNLGRGRIFVGSEDSDSVLLGWQATGKIGSLGRKVSEAGLDDEMEVEDDEDVDDLDDDLYDNTAPAVKKITAAAAEPTAAGTYTFRIHDNLPSIAPIKDTILHTDAAAQYPTTGEIMVAHGRGAAGAITALNREVQPANLAQIDLPSARGVWAVHARQPPPGGITADFGEDVEANMSADADYDQYLVVCKTEAEDQESTAVYKVTGKELELTDAGDIERDEGTLGIGVLAKGTKIIQIKQNEFRTFDSEFNMDGIISMDDDEGEEHSILDASFADPYLLVLLDDSTVKLYKASGGDEIEEMDASGLTSTQWLSASLFKSSIFSEIYAFLLTHEGGLHVFAMSDLSKPAFVAEGLCFLPPFLTTEYYPKRATSKATITEIIAADIGDATSRAPHLIIRTSTDDLVIYKAFHYPTKAASDPWTKNMRWIKLSQQHLPKYTDELDGTEGEVGLKSTLVPLDDICGYSTVFQKGSSPAFILKEASSVPRVIGLSGKAVKGLTRFNTSECQKGFAYLDADDTLRISQLPAQSHYGQLGWAARKMPMGSEIHAFSYHPRGVYVVGTGQKEEYMLQDDTYHYEWKPEDITFKPHVETGVLKIIDEKTWTVIDTHVLDPQETILCIETLNLEVSEITHERKELVAVGTAIIQGEDLATKGCIRIFEVITVVPEPDRPETNRRLRLIVKDEVKGAVSAISELGTQGFLIMAQGQKCMVRGLKEDGTLLPVAFMDMQCYVTFLKNLPGTGMLMMGDAFKGLWFTGYTEEPYKMLLFGRSKNHLEALTGAFLPFEKSLSLVISDADMNLQILQFDPDNPKSLSGTRLLPRATFHTGHFPSTTTTLPSRLTIPLAPSSTFDAPAPSSTPSTSTHQILHTTASGTLALLTPLSESTYRRLSSLATYLANTLDAACGLNPKAFRIAGESVEKGGSGGGGGVVDGNLVMRFGELGWGKQREGLGKIGGEGEEWVFWGEREVLAGWGAFGGRGGG